MVEIMLSTSFCAVPALSRVEPASTSGPTAPRWRARRPALSSALGVARQADGERTACRGRARSAPITYGVRPLAAMPDHGVGRPDRGVVDRAAPAVDVVLGALRPARRSPAGPPAMIATHRSGGGAERRRALRRVEHAEASRRSRRPRRSAARRAAIRATIAVDGRHDRRQGGPHGGGHGGVAVVHDRRQLGGRHASSMPGVARVGLARCRGASSAVGRSSSPPIRGSSASRRPSPSRLRPTTTSTTITPPGATSSTAPAAPGCAASKTIEPSDGAGGGVPRPRKLSDGLGQHRPRQRQRDLHDDDRRDVGQHVPEHRSPRRRLAGRRGGPDEVDLAQRQHRPADDADEDRHVDDGDGHGDREPVAAEHRRQRQREQQRREREQHVGHAADRRCRTTPR